MNLGNIILSTALMLSLASVFFMIRSLSNETKSFLAGQRIFYATGILILFAVLLLFSSFMNNELIRISGFILIIELLAIRMFIRTHHLNTNK